MIHKNFKWINIFEGVFLTSTSFFQKFKSFFAKERIYNCIMDQLRNSTCFKLIAFKTEKIHLYKYSKFTNFFSQNSW